MYALIETNGTDHQAQIYDHIKEHLEDNYGATVETTVGLLNSPVVVYDEKGNSIASFNQKPDEAVMNFYFNMLEG